MKMLKNINNVNLFMAGLLIVVSTSGCEDMFDINEDPSRLNENQISLSGILPPVIQFTAAAQFGASSYGSYYPQYLAGAAGQAANIDAYNPYGFDALWADAYLDAMPNLIELRELADERGAPYYAGISKLLLAVNLMISTDIWGAIPYSEAFQANENLNPAYDPMEEIYNVHLNNLLDGAIADFQQQAPEFSGLNPGVDDLIYGGNIEQWLKAAYAMRARYYLHLSEKDASYLADAVEDAERSFSNQSGEGDLQLIYNQEVFNPWYNFVANANTKSHRPSEFFVESMNGSEAGAFPGLFDPRLPILVDNSGADEYIGRPTGVPDNQALDANVDITVETYFGSRTAPIPIITYAEVKFIEAEASLESDPENAYEAYLAGIRGDMEKLGVVPAEIEAYINSPQISAGAENLTLSDILMQKYIALFLNMETWTDMRRYDYDPDIYVGLEKPGTNFIDGNPWIQRGNYPDNEPGRNTSLPEVGDQSEEVWLFEE